MDIARYYATLGVRIEKKEIAKVDSTLKALEQKLKLFGKRVDKNLRLKLDISKFDIDQKKLKAALGNALDLASARTAFEIRNFVVDQKGLNTTMINSMRRAARVAEQSVRVRPDINSRSVRDVGRIPGRTAVGAGVAGGLAARLYGPAIGLAAGGYGLSQLNRRNQEVVSAQLMTQAVVQQAGGTAGQGVQSFDWLRGQAERIGFNYLEAAPDFNKLLSGLTGAGMSVQQGQDVFQGFAELSRVNKLDKTSQNRLFRALSQVAGKNQLMSEELTGQIAEALPGGVSVFAEAWQRKLGGNLKGSEAIQVLRKAMEGREVKGDILTYAAQIASERAATGLAPASRASQAEQARFQNRISDAAIIASESGVESGFSRIFRTLNITLKESSPLVQTLAEGFDRASKSFGEIVLNVQSFKRFFEGRDSFLGDRLFSTPEDREKAFNWLASVRDMLKEIKELGSTIGEGWGMIFEQMFSGSVLEKFREVINNLTNLIGAINDASNGNWGAAGEKLKSVGWSTLNTVTTPAEFVLNKLSPELGTNAKSFLLPDRPFNPAEFESDKRAQQKMAIAQQRASDYSSPVFPVPNMQYSSAVPGVTPMELKVDVKAEITAQNAQDFAEQLNDKILSTMMQFPNKEAN